MTVREYINKKNNEYQEQKVSCIEKERRLQAISDEKARAIKAGPLHFDERIREAYAKRDRERDELLKSNEEKQQANLKKTIAAKSDEFRHIQNEYDSKVARAREQLRKEIKEIDFQNKIRARMHGNNEFLTYDAAEKAFDDAIKNAEKEKDKKISGLNARQSEPPRKDLGDESKRIDELNLKCTKEICLLVEQKERYIREAQTELDKAKKDIENHKIQSSNKIQKFLAATRDEINRLNVSVDYSVGKKSEDDIKQNSLPQTLCIGAEISNIEGQLIQDIYGKNCLQAHSPITVDIRKGQNILINVSGNDYYHNAVLERAIAGITLRYLEEFPPEALCVHVIYEHEVSMVFETLKNVFKNCGKENIVSCGSRLTERLGRIRDYISNNISSKIGGGKDIYDYFREDQSGLAKMHLVVIPNGFGHEYANDIKEIADLIQGSKWKKCGLRFLIVNDYASDNKQDNGVGENIKTIEKNSLVINFHSTGNNSGFFDRDDLRLQLTTIPSEQNAERFVEEQCDKYIRVLKSTRRDITYEDIGFGKIKTAEAEKYSSEISIPVGKSGNAVYEIPFHCENHNGRLVKNHLAVGKSGSGKSSLIHSIILNGAMKYSPEDLQFWFLDLKDGATSDHYLDSKIPHIRMVASKNTPDDIYSMLLSVLAEMKHRQRLFEDIGKKHTGQAFNCIHKYNEFVDSKRELKKLHLSRIVILIDEAQDIFNDDSVSDEIDTLLRTLVAKIRFVGIHFFLFANPLSSSSSKKLNNGYMSQCDGQFYFQLALSDVEDVNFDRKMQIRAKEIGVETFQPGHVLGTVDQKKIDEVQVALVDDIKLREKAIAERYASYPCDRIVMGKITPLLADERATGTDGTYRDLLISPEIRHEEEYSVYRTVFGSESFSTAPLFFKFGPKSGAPRIVGTNDELAASVAHSMVYSLARLRCEKEIHVVKGRGTSRFAKLLPSQPDRETTYYSGAGIDKMIYYLYEQLCSRKEQIENDFVGEFKPIFAFVNNLASLDKVVRNVPLKNCSEDKPAEYPHATGNVKEADQEEKEGSVDIDEEDGEPTKYDKKGVEELSSDELDKSDAALSDALKNNAQAASTRATFASFRSHHETDKIRILDAIEQICEDGSEFNIYLSFYTSKQAQIPKIAKILRNSDQIVIVNSLDSSIDFEGENAVRANLVASMLKKIQPSDQDTQAQDTQAVWVKDRTTCYKVRPIVYGE